MRRFAIIPLLISLTTACGHGGGYTDLGSVPQPSRIGETDANDTDYKSGWDSAISWRDDSATPLDTGATDSGTTDSGCTGDQILDCNQHCFSERIVGDGFCDHGPAPKADFASCGSFQGEQGDCPVDTGATDTGTTDTGTTDSAPPTVCAGSLDVLDCADNCYPITWLGDGHCDDGTLYVYGRPDFSCTLYAQDNGDCVPSTDTGTADSGATDTGTADSGATDTGTTDSGATDTGTADSGATDTVTADSGATDTGTADSGATDTGTADSGATDTGTTDSGTP